MGTLNVLNALNALNDGTRPVVGVINQPFTLERFVRMLQGAWYKGHPIRKRVFPEQAKARVLLTRRAVGTTAAERGRSTR